MDEKSKKYVVIAIAIAIVLFLFELFANIGYNSYKRDYASKYFRIIASNSTRAMDSKLKDYAKKEGFNLDIDYYGDLEIVDKLNEDSSNYDAVWISNSIWLYMLDNSYLTTDSKSIVIDPVVMGIKKSKAKELGFVGKNIENKDLLNAIRDKKLKYVMSSVTKTNTGATAYLNFLNSLAGSPEILTEEILEGEKLGNDLKDFFKGVERVSGDEDYLIDMFKNGDYDAMINYESTLIALNKELVGKGQEPLYLVYPVDGVAINDMPFAYINNDTTDEKKKEKFELLQNYLRSDESITLMEKLGYRAWYGGTKENVDKNTFNPDWGIDTTKYLKDMKYPSKKVMTKAFNLFIEKLRKPTHVVFCLDVSGSMDGTGIIELREAMNYILDYEQASKDMLQFSKNDKITIISFNQDYHILGTKYGNETNSVIEIINNLEVGGSTNIYDTSVEALKILVSENSDEYTKTVILMTDGMSNVGYYSYLDNYYTTRNINIPIYSITFGNSDEEELEKLARLTNGKVFDGKSGLKEAFALVRSYN